jgi:2-hydroxychromene-2-carboxylate isomerase
MGKIKTTFFDLACVLATAEPTVKFRIRKRGDVVLSSGSPLYEFEIEGERVEENRNRIYRGIPFPDYNPLNQQKINRALHAKLDEMAARGLTEAVFNVGEVLDDE